jgi:DNA-directed RNA polymerase specialized sigma subunit
MEQKERILNLVAAIQAGERDRLPALWDEVERLIKWWSNRLIVNIPGADFNDLYQCGYIALAAAVNTYKPVENASFAHWLAFYFKNEVAAFMGFRNKDPLRYAESLDAPLAEDSKTTLADTIPDSSELIEAADERITGNSFEARLTIL